ncbi:hypothetical protein LS482_21035 [Sinomicrobium kalidii]|uniref:hypothetical protein n=1 Tax=Sinomicrobium kalidii TaxID=2900738 RepID=UPI001E515A93|nr:hypothetical protein [Sinomicrobium kalidii]UGU16149.1 hypothetical protein LS482_21035 [Sinomicrobium kalidii]
MKNLLQLGRVLDKAEQKQIAGGASGSCQDYDLSLCGCDCKGSVTGPKYCSTCMGCPQVITC